MSKPILFVRQCNQCGCVVADPKGVLDAFKSNSWCPKCRSSWMTYRQATPAERVKAALHLMPVYDPDAPVKAPKQGGRRGPQTFEDHVADMLKQKDREKARAAQKAAEQFLRDSDVPQKLERMAYICDRAAEGAASDVNRECAVSIVMNFRYLVTEKDLTFSEPEGTRRVNDAIRNLYEHGGDLCREKLRQNVTTFYNIPPFALRGLIAAAADSDKAFLEILSHISGYTNEISRAMAMEKDADGTVPGFPGHLYPVFDYCVRRGDGISPEAKEQIRQYLERKAALAGNVPAYFRRYYLPDTGKLPEDPLGAWFEENYAPAGTESASGKGN